MYISDLFAFCQLNRPRRDAEMIKRLGEFSKGTSNQYTFTNNQYTFTNNQYTFTNNQYTFTDNQYTYVVSWDVNVCSTSCVNRHR